MADEHHIWRVGSPSPLLRPHSLAKHRVIEQYLGRYVEVLTGNLRIPEFCLTLVDGFAGGGLYRDDRTFEDRFGSPLLMLRAMHDSAAVAQSRRSKEFNLDVEYVFIESSIETFNCLKANLESSEFRGLLQDKITLLNGEFVNCVDQIIRRIQKRGRGKRAIFNLDQCGYSDVPFSAIRSILSQLDQAEIILTFATDSLIDYLNDQAPMQRTLENIGLQLDKQEIRSAKQEADWRRAIQFILHQRLFQSSGAKFYTPFFIRSKDAHRDYWLIHLSNHARARDVMVDLHWLENTSFAHFGKPGLMMLGYDQDHDIRVTGQQLLLPEFRFDEMARATTKESLLSELPVRIVDKYKRGVAFEQFFADITNETPATKTIINDALAQLNAEGVIEIRDKTGLTKRESGTQHRSDVLKPSEQTKFPFWR